MDKETAYEWEVLCVDDGSRDKTLVMLKELRSIDQRINYVSLSRNFGKENAMLAGFDYVTGDCMVILDADLQDPPSLIPQMLQYWEEGYEDIYAKRDNRGEESFIRRACSLLFYRILDKSTRFNVLQNVGDFRLLDRICINALKQMRENERYTKGLFCWIGYRKKELVFNRANRVAGVSKWNFWSLFNLAIEGITSFTTAPLRISTVIGFVVSFFSFFYMLYFFVKTMIYGDAVQGFPTLIIVVLFLGGIQLISIGIIGEYLGRIFNETKKRPPYLCREYNGERCMLQ
jgi:glycosyltransferase involved in cell wall biosynthesis